MCVCGGGGGGGISPFQSPLQSLPDLNWQSLTVCLRKLWNLDLAFIPNMVIPYAKQLIQCLCKPSPSLVASPTWQASSLYFLDASASHANYMGPHL